MATSTSQLGDSDTRWQHPSSLSTTVTHFESNVHLPFRGLFRTLATSTFSFNDGCALWHIPPLFSTTAYKLGQPPPVVLGENYTLWQLGFPTFIFDDHYYNTLCGEGCCGNCSLCFFVFLHLHDTHFAREATQQRLKNPIYRLCHGTSRVLRSHSASIITLEVMQEIARGAVGWPWWKRVWLNR